MTLHKYFTKNDIKVHLKDYRKIKNFDEIKKGIHIKYLIKSQNDLYEYRLGGYLKFNYPDYIVLTSQNSTWSVKKEDHLFFYKKKIDSEKLIEDINKNNNLIQELNGKNKTVFKITDEINEITKNNKDIFSNLSSNKKPKKHNIDELKKKHNIEKWEYLTNNELKIGIVICHVSLFGDKISERGLITDITFQENGTIRNITLYNNDNKGYQWKIKPHNYYLFLHPNSTMVSALFISRKT